MLQLACWTQMGYLFVYMHFFFFSFLHTAYAIFSLAKVEEEKVVRARHISESTRRRAREPEISDLGTAGPIHRILT